MFWKAVREVLNAPIAYAEVAIYCLLCLALVWYLGGAEAGVDSSSVIRSGRKLT